MSELFFERKKKELGIKLNPVQQQVVTNIEGPLLVLACPGSGKTTTMMMRIGYLIEEKKVAASNIIAITFSKASAQDMEQRYERLFPEAPKVTFSTIHSLAFSIARTYMKKNGITYELIEGNIPQQTVTKRALLKRLYKEVLKDDCPEDELKALSTFVSSLKNKMLLREEWKNRKGPVNKAGEIALKYEQFKNKRPYHLLVDFDDMLTIAEQALAEDEVLCRKIQEQYHYVLTDESQDTSYVQHKIVEHVTSYHGNLCVVADDDQSIYTWRGAEPEYLLNFKQVYPEAKIVMMERNYRSSEEIVSTAAKFIMRNKQRYAKEMRTENGSLGPIYIKQFSDQKQQLDYITYELLSESDLTEVAILFRNNASSTLFVNELHRRGIPFYMKDADDRFFSHWVVEDVLNFMRLSFNDERKDIFSTIALKMNLFLSRAMLTEFQRKETTGNVFDALIESVSLKSSQIEKIKEYKEVYRKIPEMRPAQVIRMIRTELEYEEALKSRAEKFGFHIDSLLKILDTLEGIASQLKTMVEFANRLKELEHAVQQAKFSPSTNALTLSTLHSAKGLEFRRVFMIDLVQGTIPSEEDEADTFLLEESRRLYYVGMTRAKERLELLSYRDAGGKEKQDSRFTNEVRGILHIPQEGVVTKRTVKKQATPLKNSNGISSKQDLVVGMHITHHVFGRGEIIDLENSAITIRFGENEKKLSLQMILERKLLEVVHI